MKNTICIVDAYSTGAELAACFKAAGWFCVHVQSNPVIPVEYQSSFVAKDFSILLQPDAADLAGFESVIEKLQIIQPDFIIPGTETGVAMADYLSWHLAKPGNAWASNLRRRNKFDMQQALNQAGMASISHLITDEI